MIGYTVRVQVWGPGENDPTWETAILSLDLDSIEADHPEPMLDLRLAGGEVIVIAEVEDAYDAISAVHSQLHSWKREQERKAGDS